jgi:hypothetical protein
MPCIRGDLLLECIMQQLLLDKYNSLPYNSDIHYGRAILLRGSIACAQLKTTPGISFCNELIACIHPVRKQCPCGG